MKIISISVILSLLYLLTSCYSTRTIMQKDEIKDVLQNGEGIYLETETETYNFFPPYLYKVSNDTITGIGRIQNMTRSTLVSDVVIGLDDIHQIKVKKYEPTRTGLAVLVTGGVVVAGIVFIIEMQDFKMFEK